MSDLANSPLRQAISTAQGTSGSNALRCQWCSVPLQPGITICPTCGSPGIPDPRMTVAGADLPEVHTPGPLDVPAGGNAIAPDEQALVEWWKHETLNAEPLDEPRTPVPSFEEIERRRTQSMLFIGGAVLIFGLLGWLIGPSLLVGPFEGLTGTTVEDPSDLRGMGTIGGVVIGLFIGSTGGWVISSNK